jgi:hypothetical protein
MYCIVGREPPLTSSKPILLMFMLIEVAGELNPLEVLKPIAYARDGPPLTPTVQFSAELLQDVAICVVKSIQCDLTWNDVTSFQEQLAEVQWYFGIAQGCA